MNLDIVAGFKDTGGSYVGELSKLSSSGESPHRCSVPERALFGMDTFNKGRDRIKAGMDWQFRNPKIPERWSMDDSDLENQKDPPPIGKMRLIDGYSPYSAWNWRQVMGTSTIVDTRLVSFDAQNIVANEFLFRNTTDSRATYTADLELQQTTRVTSTWNTTSAFTGSQSIKYNIGILGSGGGGQTSFSYTNTKENGGSYSSTNAVLTGVTATMTLDPGQREKVVVNAVAGKATVQVTYRLRLDGDFIFYFDTQGKQQLTYKDGSKAKHYWWVADAATYLREGGNPYENLFQQTLVIDFVSLFTVHNSNSKSPSSTVMRLRDPTEPTTVAKDFVCYSKVEKVYLVGNFTNWSEGKMTMQQQPDGSFARRIWLTPGWYQYKFLLIDGCKEWYSCDPARAVQGSSIPGVENNFLHVEEVEVGAETEEE